MVTKLHLLLYALHIRSVLAKIHMVTKHDAENYVIADSSVLAKIHMVTKPQKHAITFLN